MIKTILKWLLIIILVVAALALTAFFLDWDYITVFAVAGGCATIIAALVGLYRGIITLRERRAQDLLSADIRVRVQKLDRLWKTAIGRIKQSRLKERGNPVYVLPWYLVLGDKQSGKTTALRNSRVAIPVLEGADAPKKEDQLGNWWLMDESILIDSPGRYISPANEADEAEWNRFKHLFKKYRRWKPVNGVVVVVSAERLIKDKDEDLKSHAAQLRGRLSELVNNFGIRFPVYIMVSKADMIAGMTRFFAHYPDPSVYQAMGGMADAKAISSIKDRVDGIMQNMVSKLGELRLALLAEPDTSDVTAPAFVFPEEVNALNHSLQVFAHTLLDETLYKEAPIFRGLYFSSGRQEGQPISSFLSGHYQTEIANSQRIGERSLFLKGFFGTVLKNDKEMVMPTAQSLYLRKLQQNFGVTTWVAACSVAAVMLTVSFVQNMGTLRDVVDQLPADIVLKNEMAIDLRTLDEFKNAIRFLHKTNNESWVANMGLGQSQSVEKQLSVVYATKFREATLVPFDKNFSQSSAMLSRSSTPDELASHIDFMTKRIKLQESVLSDEEELNYELLVAKEQPDYEFMLLPFVEVHNIQNLKPILKDNYLAYLLWVDNQRLIRNDIDDEKARLTSVISKHGIGLEWLVSWSNLQAAINSVNLRQYWGVSVLDDQDDVQVPKAYTPTGLAAIFAFLKEIEAAAQDSKTLQDKRNAFIADYRRDYFNHWRDYMLRFNEGNFGWVGKDRRIELAAKLASKESPYEQLLATLPANLQPALDLSDQESDIPAWVPLAFRYDKLNDPEYQKLVMGGNGLAGKIVKKGINVLGKAKKVIKGSANTEALANADAKAVPLVIAYHDTMKVIADQTQSPQAAFVLAKATYEETKRVVGEPAKEMNKNVWSQNRLKEIIGSGEADEEAFWALLNAQAKQVWGVLLDETENYLELAWQDEVLAQATGLSGWQRIEELQGPGGKIWEFQKNFAGAFVRKTRAKGYVSNELYEDKVEFSESFYTVLNRGRVSQNAISGNYRVTIAAMPTDVNPSATEQPHLTKLVVVCAEGNVELLNYNYPVRKRVNWSPQDCGDVLLEIHVGEIILEKRYSGFNAFVRFLKDFRSGRKVFKRRDFPSMGAKMAGYRIENLTVSYAFTGHGSVLKLALKDPSNVPDYITSKKGQKQYAGTN
ncbi:MAG: hypothetical protein OEZ58_01325 [Gammaproteobacteria bacterium]|nr:hypothetical protein [Gammaproteobacteria bacterium]MDH5727618.1 hypothetical protein [Gammaproteobacteria bacterium]